MRGIGVNKNEKRAYDLYKKAVSEGDVRAKKYLADCYLWGLGTDKNIDEASRLYLEAAQSGDEEAIAFLEKNRIYKR